ncbi:MAG: tetratricopeptide repeat protein [Nitrospirota bacterium]|nr:tetratricopeptide repeat protein [Nitrospirota bacterium]
MGKNKILDTSHKTPMKNKEQKTKSKGPAKQSNLRYQVRILAVLCTIVLAPCFLACAFPRIIVLDDPLSPEEHINLGVAYEKNGELDNAIKEYEIASKKLPIAYLYLGNVYFQKNELDDAEKYYRKAIKKDPDNADCYNNLAWLYYVKKENLDEAEKLVLKAIELNPAKRAIYSDTLEKITSLK